MGSRKGYLNRLGISEYPWSSDDDNEEPQTDPRPSAAVQPRANASGQQAAASQSAPPPTPARAEVTRSDRDLYWFGLANGNASSAPHSHTRSQNPGQSSRAGGFQLPFVPRTAQPAIPLAGQRCNRSIPQDLLAFKALTRNIGLSGRTRYTIPRRSASGGIGSGSGNRISARVFETIIDPVRHAMLYNSQARARQLAASASVNREVDRVCNSYRRAHSVEPINNTDEEREPLPSTSRAADAAHSGNSPRDENDNVDTELQTTEPEQEPCSPHNTAAVSLEEVVEIPDETPALDAAVADLMQYEDSAAVVPSSSDPNLASTSRPDETDAPELVQPSQARKRRRESTDSKGEPSTARELNQSVLRLLECPVCLEWMEPPMCQCRRGHLVCSRCRVRLASCPVCRTTFSSVRNRAMEGVAEMLRYPCRHGCGREVRLRRRAPHEASCLSRKYACPAPTCPDRQGYTRAHLADHFHAKHSSLVKHGNTHKFSMRVNMEHHENYMIMALNECFHLKVDVDIRTWGVIVYVSYIGPKCYSQDYAYEVIIEGENNSRRLAYKRATHSDLENTSLSVSRQDCFHLTLDQTLNFIRFKGRNSESDRYLDFSVEVSHLDPPPTDSDS